MVDPTRKRERISPRSRLRLIQGDEIYFDLLGWQGRIWDWQYTVRLRTEVMNVGGARSTSSRHTHRLL